MISNDFYANRITSKECREYIQWFAEDQARKHMEMQRLWINDVGVLTKIRLLYGI